MHNGGRPQIRCGYGRYCDERHQPLLPVLVGNRRQYAGDEIYRLRHNRITGDDYYSLDLRPRLAVTHFIPDLPYQSAVGFEITGMDIRRLQPVAGGIWCVVPRLRYSENQPVACPSSTFLISQIVISQRTQSFSLHGST